MKSARQLLLRHCIIMSIWIICAIPGCDRQHSASDSATAAEKPMPTEGDLTLSGERFDLADFEVTLPDSMAAFDFTARDFAAASAAMRSRFDARKFDEASQMVEKYRGTGQFKLFAADLTVEDPSFLDNLNVIVKHVSPQMTQMRAASMSEQSLAEVGGDLVRRDRFTSASGTFDRLHSRFPQMETESVAYVLIRSGKLYVITFTAKPDRVGPFFEQASEIMRNFTVR